MQNFIKASAFLAMILLGSPLYGVDDRIFELLPAINKVALMDSLTNPGFTRYGTGFTIRIKNGKVLVLTCGHCFGDTKDKPSDDCALAILGSRPDRIRQGTLLARGEYERLSNKTDWALLRGNYLEGDLALTIASKEDQENLKYGDVLYVLNCENANAPSINLVRAEFTFKEMDTFTFTPPMWGGASGSPVLNAQLEVVGMVQSCSKWRGLAIKIHPITDAPEVRDILNSDAFK